MARIELTPDTLIVHLEGIHRIWALKSRLNIPLSHVRHAAAGSATPPAPPRGTRVGTRVPGLINAGVFRSQGRKVFWDAHHPARSVVIDLTGDEFDQLVIEVQDPQVTVASIQDALR
jgi:hypothetical protein